MAMSQNIIFTIRGSEGGEYEVTAVRNGGYFKMSCTCAAGQHGTFCKHRSALLDGDFSALVSENGDDVGRLKNLLAGTDAERRYKIVCDLERQKTLIDEQLKREKKALARKLT